MSTAEIGEQAALLAVSLLLGFLTGLIFDIYRRARNLFSPGPFLTALGDLCFWGVITVITFCSLFKINFGQVRGYLFLGLAVGLFLYITFFSSYVIRGFLLFDIFVKNQRSKVSYFDNRLRRLKVFKLPCRIYDDARRIYSKIKKK